MPPGSPSLDLLLAKRALAEYPKREGIDHVPFNDFRDVVRVHRQGVVVGAEE